MGYFSRLSGAIQCGEAAPAPVPRESRVQPEPTPAIQAAPQPQVTAAPAPASAAALDPVEVKTPSAVGTAEPVAAAAETPAAPVMQLDAPAPTDDDAARRAHEAAEAKRKAEWDAKQREKKAAEQARLNRLAAMSDEDVVTASTQRVSADMEKLTRRSMKDCVSEHVQVMCRQDPAFARKAMHPRKSMMRCFWYINRKAKEFIQQEMKANGVQPEGGIYGDDVPDDMVYQWAVDYFNDPDAQEDIVAEGHALHHCVGGCVDRVAQQKTMILFLRRCENLEKPFYTVEVRNQRAVQVRGMQNAAMTPEVKRFMDRWERQVLQRQELEAA